MATKAHCAFCFETLAASFEKRTPLSLAQVEESWEAYERAQHPAQDSSVSTDQADDKHRDAGAARSRAELSRLVDHAVDSAGSSSSSLPSSASAASGTATPASSTSSTSSLGRRAKDSAQEFPLFVTWNTISARTGEKTLRGCIGTFEALDLETGLRSYALTSAFEDHRFAPIPASLLPSLSVHVTLLTNFSAPTRDPLDWTLGLHGIRIAFTLRNRRYGSTYLPDVAVEQGWSKEEALVSLMRKAGWSGRSAEWGQVWREGKGELVRYEGKAVGVGFEAFRVWRAWVEEEKGRAR